MLAGTIALGGWLIGIRLSGHILGGEIGRAVEMIGRSTAAIRLTGKWVKAPRPGR
jgi:hypothetical protein